MTISEDELSKARQAWGDGVVAISRAYETGGIDAARQTAGNVLDSLYGFELGPVLFKPTLSGGAQTFRPTRAGALSYFVGHDDAYPLDSGFGIKFWREVHSQTAAMFVDERVAMWMGWVTFTDRDGQVTKVDKSFGYRRGDDGVLKIVLHHSSLPFAP